MELISSRTPTIFHEVQRQEFFTHLNIRRQIHIRVSVWYGTVQYSVALTLCSMFALKMHSGSYEPGNSVKEFQQQCPVL